MDTNTISFYLDNLHKTLNIPIVYGVFGQSLQRFQPFSITDENQTAVIARRFSKVFSAFPNKHVLYMFHRSMVMLGMVVNPQSHEFIFVGPLASCNSSKKDIADFLAETGLSEASITQLACYMNSTRPIFLENFKHLLLGINTVLNNEILPFNELAVIFDAETESIISFTKKKLMENDHLPAQKDTTVVEEYNQKLNYCIINGDMDGLADLLNQLSDIPFEESLKEMGLKEMKIATYGSVFAAENIALKSGIPAKDLQLTKQFYLEKIDETNDIEDVRRLSINVMFDFTKLVKNYLTKKTENPSINRAINYIKTNIHSKLTAAGIANALHINTHYLFTNFKTETGMTLTQFINIEKINKACYYLSFSDKSLVDISGALSFSSQTYFQTVFKQVKGLTPVEWQKQNSYIKK